MRSRSVCRNGSASHPHRRSHGPDRGRRLAPADRSDVRSARRSYRFGWGTGSRKLTGPAIAASDLGPIDAVLLSHDHHDDNLDAAGRAFLPSAGTVSPPSPVRSASAGALAASSRGRAHGSRRRGGLRSRSPPRRVATALRSAARSSATWSGSRSVGTGRSTASSGSRATRCSTTVCGRSPIACGSGPRSCIWGAFGSRSRVRVRYTMTAEEAVELCRLVRPRTVIPIHYEGWKHFREGREAIERELADAPEDVRDRVRWLPIGVATGLAA